MKAIVTGASAGMGWYFAKELAARGYDLVVVARRVQKLEELKKEIEKEYKVKVEILQADLSTEKAQKDIIKLASETDLILNNAAFGLNKRSWQYDADKLRMMTRLNVETPTVLSLEFARVYKEKGHGRIINVSSTGALPKAYPMDPAYAAGKLAIKSLGTSMRMDLRLAKSKVKVQTVLPGSVKTEFIEKAAPDKDSSKFPATPADKFAKVVIHRLLDKNKKEVYYGKYAKMFKYMTKIVPAKTIAKNVIKMTSPDK